MYDKNVYTQITSGLSMSNKIKRAEIRESPCFFVRKIKLTT